MITRTTKLVNALVVNGDESEVRKVLAHEDVKEMQKHYFPDEVVYMSQCTESCAATINDRYHLDGFCGTLDYSLCYDTLRIPLAFKNNNSFLK